jgi:hypothetical protein
MISNLSPNFILATKTRILSEIVKLFISLIHTFVNNPALLLKNTLRFLIRAGILTKV